MHLAQHACTLHRVHAPCTECSTRMHRVQHRSTTSTECSMHRPIMGSRHHTIPKSSIHGSSSGTHASSVAHVPPECSPRHLPIMDQRSTHGPVQCETLHAWTECSTHRTSHRAYFTSITAAAHPSIQPQHSTSIHPAAAQHIHPAAAQHIHPSSRSTAQPLQPKHIHQTQHAAIKPQHACITQVVSAVRD